MKIDWAALGVVAAVSVAMTLVFVVLLSYGIRLVAAAKAPGVGQTDTGRLGAGYALLAGAGLLVLFGIYLIVPQFG